jgi:hypothetical protein
MPKLIIISLHFPSDGQDLQEKGDFNELSGENCGWRVREEVILMTSVP